MWSFGTIVTQLRGSFVEGLSDSPQRESLRSLIMAKNDRFEKVYTQGAINIIEIWVDKETGVNYIFRQSGYSGGMTPLLDRDGKPVVSPIVNR